jgi:hypothetical protein
MERSLHRQLKELYGLDAGGRTEVRVDGYRVDAVGIDGELIEVQSGPIGPLIGKLARLLCSGRRVTVVKPVVLERVILRKALRSDARLSERRSPWRGAFVDVFDDLMGVARLLDVPEFTIELLGVVVRELRLPSRSRRGYRVEDRELIEVRSRRRITRSDDLWALLPRARLPDPFTTADLGRSLERPRHFAQRVAYCLRIAGAASIVGKTGNSWLYARRVVLSHGTPGSVKAKFSRTSSESSPMKSE